MSNWQGLTQDVWRAQLCAFGETVLYRHITAGDFSIKGIFNSIFEVVEVADDTPIGSNVPTLGIRLQDIPAKLTPQDTVEFRGYSWMVVSSNEDGEGFTQLVLHKGAAL